jgi:hypothetical protein
VCSGGGKQRWRAGGGAVARGDGGRGWGHSGARTTWGSHTPALAVAQLQRTSPQSSMLGALRTTPCALPVTSTDPAGTA